MALAGPYISGQVVHSVCPLLLSPAEHSGNVIWLRGVLLQIPSIGTAIAELHPPDLNPLWARPKQAAAARKAVRATFEGMLKYCSVQTILPDGRGVWHGCGNSGYYLHCRSGTPPGWCSP